MANERSGSAEEKKVQRKKSADATYTAAWISVFFLQVALDARLGRFQLGFHTARQGVVTFILNIGFSPK